jgi:hypothetical protein
MVIFAKAYFFRDIDIVKNEALALSKVILGPLKSSYPLKGLYQDFN